MECKIRDTLPFQCVTQPQPIKGILKNGSTSPPNKMDVQDPSSSLISRAEKVKEANLNYSLMESRQDKSLNLEFKEACDKKFIRPESHFKH